jgi:hypothetical protein
MNRIPFALTILAAIALVVATLTGASATRIVYSSMSSTPFGGDGFGMVTVTERGVGSYGGSWSPEGFVGGMSTRDGSFGFGYDYNTGVRHVSVSSRELRGSWNRGIDGFGYGAFSAGGARTYGTWNVNGFGNAWGSHAAFYSPYSGAWGSRWSNTNRW